MKTLYSPLAVEATTRRGANEQGLYGAENAVASGGAPPTSVVADSKGSLNRDNSLLGS